jgi:hypothetical protein
MGVRGAWSVVSSDPRRFGEPWVCSVEQSVIWIDGPSLVYFLALQPKFDQVDRFHGRYNQIGQASPATIYKRAVNFFTVLSQLSKEVHVVMDGVCSAAKIPTQIDRMSAAAQQAEEAARSSTSPKNCKVISILAEWTVVDALEKLSRQITSLQLHRLAIGEAEAFIDATLMHQKDKNDVVVMSNDTDFLIYKHCPGFLPFTSLQFTPVNRPENGDDTFVLTGFHYLASNFRRAFFLNCFDHQVLTSVAGLTGCDYDDDILKSARAIIVKSEIGGLRVKHQNKPTMQLILRAVLRYVGHYVKMGESWRISLGKSIGGDAILKSLNAVHQNYLPSDPSQMKDTEFSLECHRLIVSGTLFCRPLIEYWSSSSIRLSVSKPKRTAALSKRSRKRRKKRQLLEVTTASVEGDDTLEGADLQLIEPIDLADAPHIVNYEKIQEYLRKGSAWTLPHFQSVRVRLYGLMKSTNGLRTPDLISEWRRSGNGQSLEYKEARISITPNEGLFAVEDMMKSCSVTSPIEESCQTCAVDLTKSLLPPRIRWVWYLLMTIPSRQCLQHSMVKGHDSELIDLLCLAYYHSRLATEVIATCNGGSQPDKVDDQSLEKLDADVARWIFSIIQDLNISDLPERFFESSQVVGTHFGDTWRNNLLVFLECNTN